MEAQKADLAYDGGEPNLGPPRIHGELLMLGFDVSERTISRWMNPWESPCGHRRGQRLTRIARRQRCLPKMSSRSNSYRINNIQVVPAGVG